MNKENIERVANEMIVENGLINLTRQNLSERAGIPDGSFNSIMGCTFSDFVEEIYSEVDTEIHKVNNRRTNPLLRRDQILNVAVCLSKKHGYNKITREAVAHHAEVSASLISKYFNTMTQLRRAIIRFAVQHEIVEIIAQGIANRDIHLKNIPDELRAKAIELITGGE